VDDPITQIDPTTGHEVPNLHEQAETELHNTYNYPTGLASAPAEALIQPAEGAPPSSSAAQMNIATPQPTPRAPSEVPVSHGSSDLETTSFVVSGLNQSDASDWWHQASNSPLTGDTPQDKAIHSSAFSVDTRLGGGEHGLLVDIGSLGNLAGDVWVQEVAADCISNGRQPSEVKRVRPLKVSGVGNGSQAATYNCKVPIALEQLDGTCENGLFDTPTVSNSNLPGLLGLTTLTNKRAVIDLTTNQLHFLGPGATNFVFPEGTVSYQLKTSPSGHLMLPCTKYQAFDKQQASGHMKLDHEEVNLHANASASSSTAQ